MQKKGSFLHVSMKFPSIMKPKMANISSGEMNGIKICQNKGHINGKITENLIEKNKNLIHNKL